MEREKKKKVEVHAMATQSHASFYTPDNYLPLRRTASDPSDALVYHAERESSSLSDRCGEGRLMFEVLDGAIHDFVIGCLSNRHRAVRLGEEAKEWIYSDEREWIYSFLSICKVLKLSPDGIRKRLGIAEEVIRLMVKHEVITTRNPHLILIQVNEMIKEKKELKTPGGCKVTQ